MLKDVSFDLISFAERLAGESATVLRRFYRSSQLFDPVNQGGFIKATPERKAEELMRDMLNRNYPSHGVISEHFPEENRDAEFVWVMNPINGTRAYVAGKPLFSTIVTLLYHKKPVLGLIQQPVIRETWIGARGHKTRFNGINCSARKCFMMSRAILNSTYPDYFPRHSINPGFEALKNMVKVVTYGGDAYSIGLLCNGHIDIVIEPQVDLYSYLAFVPLVEGADGMITDFQGQPLHLDCEGNVLATGDPRLHREVITLLNQQPKESAP